MNEPKNVLLLMSGSIACAKATALISGWRRRGWRVRVATTRSVSRFLGSATLEGLAGEPPFDDTFGAGRAMDHIALAQWADVIVACPATSHLIARLAAGLADDAVTSLWQAAWGRGKPMFVVPAMNTHMWEYPATRENVARLASWGVEMLPTAEGDLACGESGAGRMLEPEAIIQQVDARFAGLMDPGTGTAGRVLVTGGGTREPIDAVRYIGNHSTGVTAAAISDTLASEGFTVTWLGADTAVEPSRVQQRERFRSFSDLDRQLRRLLSEERFDLVVHAAAVSDFSVVDEPGSNTGQRAGKLSSDRERVLHLSPNPKLLGRLRDYADDPALRVAGFKLTVDASPAEAEAAVRRQFSESAPDLVVHNDLADIRQGRHRFLVSGPSGTRNEYANAADLARGLADSLLREMTA